MEAPLGRLHRKYPVGKEFELTIYDGDGPYLVRVISHKQIIEDPGDHEYRPLSNTQRETLQIKFLGKIPRYYYHPDGRFIVKGADNYAYWDDGFWLGTFGKGPKPPRDYYKYSKKIDREKKDEKERDPRNERKKRRKLRKEKRH